MGASYKSVFTYFLSLIQLITNLITWCGLWVIYKARSVSSFLRLSYLSEVFLQSQSFVDVTEIASWVVQIR